MPTRPARHPARTARYWPNAEQTLLLQAAVRRGEAARDAWTRWTASVDLNRLDAASERLVPLAAHNLTRAGLDAPRLGRLEHLRHYTWAKFHRRTASLLPVLQALHRDRIPTMLLKGLALVSQYYEHPGLRPMDDVDLLVGPEHALWARAILEDRGWRPVGAPVDPATLHAQSFEADDRWPIDLHWRALWEVARSRTDASVWAHAVPADLGGVPVVVPSPADLCFQVIVHGSRWNDTPSFRWIADAATVITARGGTFDWDRFVALADDYELVLPIRQALGLLVEVLDVPVPAAALAALDAHRASTFERVEQRLREWTSSPIGCFPLVLCHHVRLARADGAAAVVLGLPRYLQHAYGLPSLWSVPVDLGVRAARRVTRAAGWRA